MSVLKIFQGLNVLPRVGGCLGLIRNYAGCAPKKAVVFLACGSEEMEVSIAADVLRRAGVKVTVAGCPDEKPKTCSQEVVITPDCGICDVAKGGPYDALVIPGGKQGVLVLAECEVTGKMLKEQDKCAKIVAAISAGPLALKAHCIAKGKEITSYPSLECELTEGGFYCYKTTNVVVDEHLITSRGPGTAYLFALNLVEKLVSQEKACEIAKALLVKY